MAATAVSGFTFCRNAVALGYPLQESIRSILPIVDEFIVAVGPSVDSTVEAVEKIGSSKIRIVESLWDETQKSDARVLSAQANFALSHCRYPWAFHLQADEVVHENDLPLLVALMQQHLENMTVLGLMFRFVHFVLDYCTINPWAFRREVRIVRNNGQLRSAGDSCGFVRKSDGVHLSKRLLGREVISSGARIFHYSSVMPREALERKARAMVGVRWGNLPEADQVERSCQIIERFERQYFYMKEYRGGHPAVMRERLAAASRFHPRLNRWLNWRFYLHVFAHGFKG